MYRTHTCGELRIKNVGSKVTLCGWLQRSRDFGGMTFVDLRDRYGITQLVFNMETNKALCNQARELGREYVLQVNGEVAERSNKNKNLDTGDVEILVDSINVLNPSELPPFTIEDETDGGEELRMKYRYLDLRRNIMKNNLVLRHNVAKETRKYLDKHKFLEIETPVLIKSTPEGARDFVVPSRMHPGQFYALPQSPQTFKQLLMVAGYDRYFQIVKCFRDEDFRADRQPEFTQIDCEMAFVDRKEVMDTFEGMTKHLFNSVLGFDLEGDFPVISYNDAMNKYGNDKPDMRFGMLLHELSEMAKGKGFKVFDEVEYIGGFRAEGCANYTRKQIDELTEFVKKPQIGANGLVYVKYNEDGTFKSSVDKFYGPDDLKQWASAVNAEKGDLILILAGAKKKTLHALSELRLEMGNRLGLLDKNKFAPLWVVDFPLLEYDEETKRYYAMHHPFTSPVKDDLALFDTAPANMRAEAYDLVINGVEIGGGSIRIHDREIQQKMLHTLGFSPEEAREQFGFLMDAFQYGAPPHGGIALGFDRLVALFCGEDSIREVMAFPKNNAGRDMMIDSPASISEVQLKDLGLKHVK